MRIASALRASFFVALAALIGSAPASALNRINDYYGMNLSSGWVIQSQRDVRLGFGQLIYDMFGSTNGAFSHIAVTPSTGLFVQVGPSAPNTRGSVYQFQQDDVNVYGSGATQLSADPTQIFVQGALSTPTIALGPFTAPTSTGQSIADLIECQVQTVDATPQTELFETAPNTTVSQTANRDRNDIVACRIESGSATTAIPVAPAADAGWVPVASVFVANGQTSLAQSNVTLSTTNQFYGFVPANASGGFNLPHGDYANANLSNVPATTGLSIASLILAANGAPSPTFPTIANDAAPGPGFNLSVPNTSTYGFRYFNVTSNGTLTQIGNIDALGNATYAGTVAADAFNVTHNLTISGNVVGNSGSSVSIGSGSFSSQVTSPTYILQANDPTTAYVGLSNGNNGFKIAQPGAGTMVQGIQCTLLGIAQSNVGYKACMNQNGDLGVTGSLLAQGVQSVGTIYSKTAPVAPVFNASGAAVSNTWHEVYVTGTTASSQSNCGVTSNYYCATVNLSGSATFASNLTFSCDPASTVQNAQPFSGPAGNGGGVYLAGASSGSTLFFGSATNGGATFSTVCRGT